MCPLFMMHTKLMSRGGKGGFGWTSKVWICLFFKFCWSTTMHLFSQLNYLTFCSCQVSLLQGKGYFCATCSVCSGVCLESSFILLASLCASIFHHFQEVIIWAASIWNIKIGVMLEGPFTGTCQLIEQYVKGCEVLSRLLCMTNIFAVKAAKCEHLWILWARDLNYKG